jgi:hypothetical protein
MLRMPNSRLVQCSGKTRSLSARQAQANRLALGSKLTISSTHPSPGALATQALTPAHRLLQEVCAHWRNVRARPSFAGVRPPRLGAGGDRPTSITGRTASSGSTLFARRCGSLGFLGLDLVAGLRLGHTPQPTATGSVIWSQSKTSTRVI